MGDRLGKNDDIAPGLLRLLNIDLHAAIAGLTDDGPLDARIHKVRQRLKRVRSLLRVLEPAFGEQAIAARRNVAAAARLLARARDADVAAASARVLARETAAGEEDIGFAMVAERLDHEAARMHQKKTPLSEVRKRLTAISGAIAQFDADFDGREMLAKALERAYRKGRRGMRRAETSLATPDLHLWRKDVKHLWHLVRLARSRLPDRSARLAKRLDRLSEVLGLDHDHAMLAEKLALSPTGDLSLMRQLAVIAERRRGLEAEALDLGGRVFKRPPKEFAKDLKPG